MSPATLEQAFKQTRTYTASSTPVHCKSPRKITCASTDFHSLQLQSKGETQIKQEISQMQKEQLDPIPQPRTTSAVHSTTSVIEQVLNQESSQGKDGQTHMAVHAIEGALNNRTITLTGRAGKKSSLY